MEFINPTLEWYKSVSAKSNLPPRCPFASSYKKKRKGVKSLQADRE
jgi:hypothetical protein